MFATVPLPALIVRLVIDIGEFCSRQLSAIDAGPFRSGQDGRRISHDSGCNRQEYAGLLRCPTRTRGGFLEFYDPTRMHKIIL